MVSESRQGSRSSSDERRVLLLFGQPGEKQLLPQQNILLDVEPPRARRRRILLRHLQLATIVVTAFLFFAFLKNSGKHVWQTMAHHFGGCSHAGEGPNMPTTAPVPEWCYSNSTEDYTFDFGDVSHWRFEEAFDLRSISTKYFRSDIRLQSAASDVEKDITVKISVATNNEDVIQLLDSQKSSDKLAFKIVVPRGTRDLCLSVMADIFVKPGTKLFSLDISSDMASLDMLPGLEEVAIDQTNIDVQVGSITASPLNSRETRIDSRVGSISGTYDLYDLLSVRTASGSVQIDVVPKEADEDKPRPALLLVDSKSGSVDVNYPPGPATEIPARDYETHVAAVSGSVRGSYIHGRETSIKSVSGEVAVTVLPFAADESPSSLGTETNMGTQDVMVLSPYNDTGTPMRSLQSSHVTNTGSLQVQYPQEWEGKIEGSTKFGSLRLEGRDVRVTEKGGFGPISRWVKAVKGDGESRLRFGTQTGSIDVTIGDL